MALLNSSSRLKFSKKIIDLGIPVLLNCRKNHGSLYYSTIAEKEGITAPRTSIKSPSLHTRDHLGLWYTVEEDVLKNILCNTTIPKNYARLCESFRETSFMVREPAITVIDYIKRSNLSLPPNKFMLYGRPGAGKSISLAHILHFLSEDGWLLIHIPWLPRWRRGFKELTPSTTFNGGFDHPADAAAWLLHFRSQNAGLLKELDLTTSEEYVWSRREKSEVGTKLTALIDHGLSRNRFATDVVMALTQELKKHATEGRCKLAIGADGLNSFFCPVSTHKVDHVTVEPQRFTLFKAFMHFFDNDWKNGCIVGTLDARANEAARRESDMPRYLLRQMGWEALDPFVPVFVDDYDDREMRSIIDYYIDREWLQTVDGCLGDARIELATYSGHNPGEVMRLCAPL